MNIKRQIRLLYLYEGMICFRITDVVWVIFLAQRGFSLAQIGFAEGVFHLTSMLCEVPSGMAADLAGRKRTLAAACICGILSSVLMGFGNWEGSIYFGMVFSALSYNLVSGTEEALLYDSLIMAGDTENYKKIRSNMSVIAGITSAVSCAVSPISIFLGCQKVYLITAFLGLCTFFVVLSLQEALVTHQQKAREKHPLQQIGQRTLKHVRATFYFIRENPRTMCKLFADAAVSCPCYLIMMYLQEHLADCGWPQSWIGIPLLLIPLSSAVGAQIAARSKRKLFGAMFLCGIFGGIGAVLSGSRLIPVVAAGACLGNICQGFAEVAVSENVNRDFSSGQRATLISVDSMFYSVLMIGASPLTGYMASYVSIPAALAAMGILMIMMTSICCLVYHKYNGAVGDTFHQHCR